MPEARQSTKVSVVVCAEGCPKGWVSRLSGASAALSLETSYVNYTVIRAVDRELVGLFGRAGRIR